MSQIKQPRRRIQTGQLVATTDRSLYNCIKSGKNNVVYHYNELSYKLIDRQFITSY